MISQDVTKRQRSTIKRKINVETSTKAYYHFTHLDIPTYFNFL